MVVRKPIQKRCGAIDAGNLGDREHQRCTTRPRECNQTGAGTQLREWLRRCVLSDRRGPIPILNHAETAPDKDAVESPEAKSLLELPL